MNHQFARRLRKDMTDAEQHLWYRLRYRQVGNCKFRRQAPIGIYVVDFVCFERKVIIELDGSQHAEREAIDAERTKWLKSQGFRILRFWNHEIFEDTDWVLEMIAESLQSATPHPNPPPQGGRE
jgi:very-short-patch-repair endonuclease